jgi:SAM-dependent methyltransferase
MEAFSARFLADNRRALARYGRRWGADPLHHVTRQWEYPFVGSQLDRMRDAGEPTKTVLDAGSGTTFFPYFVADSWPDAVVECIDQDAMVRDTHRRLTSPARARVRCETGDLHALPYDAGRFDAIYCISVLEHTRDYRAILAEFARVLRPGGRLMGTFDVSLDGRSEITREGASDLLVALRDRFTPVDAPGPEAVAGLDDPSAVTTGRLRDSHAQFMPWKRTWRTFVASLARGRYPHRQFYDIGVIAGVYRKD